LEAFFEWHFDDFFEEPFEPALEPHFEEAFEPAFEPPLEPHFEPALEPAFEPPLQVGGVGRHGGGLGAQTGGLGAQAPALALLAERVRIDGTAKTAARPRPKRHRAVRRDTPAADLILTDLLITCSLVGIAWVDERRRLQERSTRFSNR